MPLLRHQPWENVPGLLQGVTLKDGSGEGVSFGRLEGSLPALGFNKLARLQQVHGSRVLDQDDPAFGGSSDGAYPAGDGVLGNRPGLLGVVSAADCVLVFLLGRKARVWAVVHAGWRGVVSGVLAEAVRMLSIRHAIEAVELELYLGPSICGKCYRVGEDVSELLAAAGDGHGLTRLSGGSYADIRAILAHQARGLGLRREALAVSRYCTSCHNEYFCSFRSEGKNGLRRMWGVMGFDDAGARF